jgi:hypothetical protein
MSFTIGETAKYDIINLIIIYNKIIKFILNPKIFNNLYYKKGLFFINFIS